MTLVTVCIGMQTPTLKVHSDMRVRTQLTTVEVVRLIYSCVSKQFNHCTCVLWEMHAILFIPPGENFTTQQLEDKDTNKTHSNRK